jgi:hypothetical protein
MKEQITELRPRALIQTDNLAIEDGFPSEGQSRSPAKRNVLRYFTATLR